ncbi:MULTISPECIES: bacteriophage antitermination protein Q [Pantoea]|uniref:Antitermination protein n=2 Tax=Pantoea TaxID=53335 RepID=A0AB34CH56_9GAMM|nr:MULTISPECIES: bacteriophage antitermination protein Q [Pantoea]KAA5927844.1 antitermination protein [Pantoea sp. VH_8]KAA5932575.1 antitermination protein [Pantoea sp. VH_4]KAA5984841.1 antitermination protein [Pantoea sp. M_4]KAA6122202.1 antitermination protein [Pantoea gossypiicola]
MTPQLLEYARIELTRALMDHSGKTKGQLQAFCEHPPADKDRSPRKPIHVVELDNGRGGVQCVKAENSAVYVLETRSRRRPLPPINDCGFSAAPWRRAVNMLPEHEQAWLKYCYGFDLNFRYQTLICEAIWNEHQKHLPEGLMRKTKKRLIALVWLAVQEVATMNLNETYKQYAGAALAGHLGVSRSTWCEIYAPHWRALKSAVTNLDCSALDSVLYLKQDKAFDDAIS